MQLFETAIQILELTNRMIAKQNSVVLWESVETQNGVKQQIASKKVLPKYYGQHRQPNPCDNCTVQNKIYCSIMC